jgi:hypothetical protein
VVEKVVKHHGAQVSPFKIELSYLEGFDFLRNRKGQSLHLKFGKNLNFTVVGDSNF